MAKGRGRVHVVTPTTKTVAAQFGAFDRAFTVPGGEGFTPRWDKTASGQQGMDRAQARARMGRKRTPLGAGKLMKKGR